MGVRKARREARKTSVERRSSPPAPQKHSHRPVECSSSRLIRTEPDHLKKIRIRCKEAGSRSGERRHLIRKSRERSRTTVSEGDAHEPLREACRQHRSAHSRGYLRSSERFQEGPMSATGAHRPYDRTALKVRQRILPVSKFRPARGGSPRSRARRWPACWRAASSSNKRARWSCSSRPPTATSSSAGAVAARRLVDPSLRNTISRFAFELGSRMPRISLACSASGLG
ncbi:hypothetical protein VAR608DRAFT_2484 [Variovorax sp. HW608]|nr:hypothetical protein VAR608DRAFT_2484 [Variovorax sp. HW608]